MNLLEIGEITLDKQDYYLIAFVVILALVIAQFSVNILRKRQIYISSILLLVLAAFISYAVNFYYSIKAPQYVAKKAVETGHKAEKALINSNKEANENMKNIAHSYQTTEYKEQ